MCEKFVSIGDDVWIEDDHGERLYKVDGKVFWICDMFILEDCYGCEVVKIQECKFHVCDTLVIERDGCMVVIVHKVLVGICDWFKIDVEDGEDFSVHGNVFDYEYEIKCGGDVVVIVLKKWFRVCDMYGIEVFEGEDELLVLAVVVVLDELTGCG